MSQKKTTWGELSKAWPEIILLKDVNRLENFPYSRGYFRNLCTGHQADVFLRENLFRVGKFPAMRKQPLAAWLEKRTRI
jgi:hypothetical protein